MARYSYSYSGFSNYHSCSKGGYIKSYDNSTCQTCAQRYSPTKTRNGTWYDANGNRIRNTKAYFSTISSNGKYWKYC